MRGRGEPLQFLGIVPDDVEIADDLLDQGPGRGAAAAVLAPHVAQDTRAYSVEIYDQAGRKELADQGVTLIDGKDGTTTWET